MAIFLIVDVHDEGDGWIDALIEALKILVKVHLVDMSVLILDVVDDVLYLDAVESFDRIVKFGLINSFNGCSGEIDGDEAHM